MCTFIIAYYFILHILYLVSLALPLWHHSHSYVIVSMAVTKSSASRAETREEEREAESVSVLPQKQCEHWLSLATMATELSETHSNSTQTWWQRGAHERKIYTHTRRVEIMSCSLFELPEERVQLKSGKWRDRMISYCGRSN